MLRLVNGMRTLATILVAVTLLLAPLAIGAGAVASAAPHPHASMAADEHCRMLPSSPGDDQESADETCCIAMCMALAVDAGANVAEVALPLGIGAIAVPAHRDGRSQGAPTPPPKLA